MSVENLTVGSQVLSFTLHSPAIKETKIQVIPNRVDRMAPIVSYLKKGTLLENHTASRRMKVRASRFVLIGDVLYKRGFSHPYLRCLVLDEAGYVMREVHKGVCGNHAKARSLDQKLI